MARRMTVLSDTLVHGVSQQIAPKRTTNHWEDAVNIRPSIVTGNTKRTSFKVRGVMPWALSGDDAYHFYTRDTQEKYLVVVSGGTIRVIDRITGTSVPVSFPDGTGYLTSLGTPKSSFDFLTLGDSTLIVNRERVVAMSTLTTPSAVNEALIYVRRGDYGRNYKVVVNGVIRADYTTSSTVVTATGTDDIATNLANQLTTFLGAGWTITRNGSVVRLRRVDGTAFTASASDGEGGEGVMVVMGAIQRFEKLPDKAPNGYLVRVSGDQGKLLDDYYVQFRAFDPTSVDGNGVWEETTAPGIKYRLDAATMPHVLRRLPDGTFQFSREAWDDRKVGDANSVPEPSFVGQKINSLFFFQNRLGFIAGENHISSVTSDYFNFWRQSARTALETDPVDAAATISRAITLRYAIPYNRQLILFADDAQIIVQGGQTFSFESVSTTVASEYRMDPQSRPVAVGQSIFFTAGRGAFSGGVGGGHENTAVMEMRVSEDGSGRVFAVEVSEHIPNLIPGGAVLMAASSTEKALLLVPVSEPTRWFGYHWMFRGQEQVISSWAPYELSGGYPLAIHFEDSTVEVMAQYGINKPVFGAIDLNETGRWLGSMEDSHLDYSLTQAQVTRAYSPTTYRTTITSPIGWTSPVVLKEDPTVGVVDLEEELISYVWNPDGTSVTVVDGDHTSGQMRIGEPIHFSLTFTGPYAPVYGPRGEMIPDQAARVQVARGVISYSDTGPFEVLVQKPSRADRIHEFSGIRLGSVPARVGAPPVTSGTFRFTVNGDSVDTRITVRGRSWLPFNITAAKWLCSKVKSVNR